MNLLSKPYARCRKSIRSVAAMMLAALVSCTLTNAVAQENTEAGLSITVSGAVKDASGDPIVAGTVLEKGSTSGTSTDASGSFKLTVKGTNSVLVVSFLGYKTREIPVGGQREFLITLEEDALQLDEMVVIGYGTQRKGDVTSAIVSVKSEDFSIGKIGDAAELIKGKVAGLSITKSSGDPNASSSIKLRGISTLNGDFTPLVLVDGIPGDLTAVAPENIETIDVLKDASAAAIYGTRGANGVIIITTKSGKREQPLRAVYSAYASTSDFLKKAEFMGPSDIRTGKTAFGDDGWDTDWLKAVTQKGSAQNHSLSIDGGVKSLAYSANVHYLYEEGTIKQTDKKELRLQLNLTQYLLNDMLKVNMNILKGLHTNTNSNSTNGDQTNIYRQALIHNPTSPIYNEDGTYYEEFSRYLYYNPVSMLNERIGSSEYEWTRMNGNVTLEPLKGWQTNLMVSRNTYNGVGSNYETEQYYASLTSGHKNGASKSFNNSREDHLELTSRYDYSADEHRFSALAGYSYSYNVYSGFNAWNQSFPTDVYLYNNLGVGDYLKEGKAGMGSYKNDNTLAGFFGRVSYGFGNRYNVLASIRREGSSRFGENNKWGTFPSVSVGWTISNEEFMKPVAVISNLKLRAGYGVTGQIAGSNYASLTTYTYSGGYYLNNSGSWTTGLAVTQNPNPDLKWETTSEFNVGIDFGLLNGRLIGSIDLYNRETNDLLYWYDVPVPPNLYGSTLANVGSMQNRGVEVMLGGSPVKMKDFEWSTTLTFSYNANKLLSISNDMYQREGWWNTGDAGEPVTVPTQRVEVGKGIGNFWGLKSVGVTKDGHWLIEDPKTGDAIEYTTALNDDYYRQYLGNGIPNFIAGWNHTFRYKDFDLNIQTSGQFGFKILNEQRMFYENNSIQYNKLKSAADLVYGVAPLASNQQQAFVSYYLEDGDYLKFDNVTLGYTYALPANKYLQSVRVYAAGQNLFCITGYSGLDPELNNTIWNAGRDPRDKYPTIRSFTLGLNINF
ncbi:MAG: TonB-dependent receptor [Prevotellaceae bacterium]|jgi:TonB-linked SusC/RagA family outer membrane protein|nr:TonB-dependent receptor [Prevotellaceae bacterium]